jgi:hypothetical protein
MEKNSGWTVPGARSSTLPAYACRKRLIASSCRSSGRYHLIATLVSRTSAGGGSELLSDSVKRACRGPDG